MPDTTDLQPDDGHETPTVADPPATDAGAASSADPAATDPGEQGDAATSPGDHRDAPACPACGAPAPAGTRYCEACGHDLSRPAPITGRASVPGITSGTSEPPPPICASCGGEDFGEDGYCEHCGARRPAAAGHSEVDLGAIAGVSDIGLRHHHNEDAMGLAIVGLATAGVVCDGVSSSNRPDTASTAAAVAAIKVFISGLTALAEAAEPVSAQPVSAQPVTAEPAPGDTSEPASGDTAGPASGTADSGGADRGEVTDEGAPADGGGSTGEGPPADEDRGEDDGHTARTQRLARPGYARLLRQAGEAAHLAAAEVGAGDTSPNPPSTTFVAAVVTADAITVGWVGDSRAYWLPFPGTPGRAVCLTVDDTLAGQLAAAGVPISGDAPNAAALIRWLGSDATDTEPHTSTITPPGPGLVIVCTDGLHRYAADPDELAAVTPAGTPHEIASTLVRYAVDAGGQDNVTVVVMPYPPVVKG